MTPEPRRVPVGSREDARVGRTRADVSHAALGLLTREGSDAVTHARVAEAAGYSKTTLYNHWPTRLSLIVLALDALAEVPHQQRSGDPRADLIGQLQVFRQAVADMGLDRVLAGMAQWATNDEMHQVRHRVNTSGQRPLRTMLGELFDGAELEAAVSMLSGVVACPSIMFGRLPDDETIAGAVDIVLRGRLES